jgi:hypothetical protein
MHVPWYADGEQVLQCFLHSMKQGLILQQAKSKEHP